MTQSPYNPCVLVVDDAVMRSFVLKVLTRRGYDCLEAACGSEAVEVYRGNADRVRLVFLDVRMPGLDGPETLAALRRLDAGVRCCFMSGDTTPYTVPQLLGCGAIGFLAKPFWPSQLAAVLAVALGPALPPAGPAGCQEAGRGAAVAGGS